ncbi:unnamed protein product, partial [Ectocarpus sp. 12 AP-2014]
MGTAYAKSTRSHDNGGAGRGGLCYGQVEDVCTGTESARMGRLGRFGVHNSCSGDVLDRRQAKAHLGRSSRHWWNLLVFG